VRVIYFNKVRGERIATQANIIPFVMTLTALAEPDVLLHLLPVPFLLFLIINSPQRRSQWPRGLRRWSSAARLLRLCVRIPPGAWMFVVSVVCCQVEVSATD
jgi:hypothetical protein